MPMQTPAPASSAPLQTQQAAEDAPPPPPSAQEVALVKRWLEKIKKKRDSKAYKAHCDAVKKGRLLVAGDKTGTNPDGTIAVGGTKANILFAKIAGAEQRVYAKNPQMVVTPEDQVEQQDLPGQPQLPPGTDPADQEKMAMAQFCKTAEVLLGRAFVKEGRLKERAKMAVRRAFTSRVAWAKVVYSKNKRTDPIVLAQLKDSQDNMMRLEAQLKRLRKPSSIADIEAEKAELAQTIASLHEQSEVVLNEGLVIDILEPTAVIVLKSNRQDFGDYIQAPAIVHSELYTAEDMRTMFQLSDDDIGKLTKHRQDGSPGTLGDDEPLFLVHEVWNQDDQQVLTLAEGLDRFLREPWVPRSQGSRWYPFFPLAFYLVDGREYPLSAPELLEQLQVDYENTRQMQEEHRAESMPSYFAAGGATEESDITTIVQRKANQINVLKSWAPGTPFNQVIGRFEPVPMNPEVYDTGPIRADMEMVFGVSDAATGGTVDAKTATEASIVEAQFGERVNSFVDTVEDWIGEMGHYSLELLLLELNEAQVKYLCGSAATWPQLTREEIYENIRVQVLAGSTSKPNKKMERETWLQFLPLLMQMMTAYGQSAASGNMIAANAVKEVAKETARRFDERINVDRFFPDVPPAAAPMLPGQQPGAPGASPIDPSAMPPNGPQGAAPNQLAMPELPLTAAAAQSQGMLPSPQQVQ